MISSVWNARGIAVLWLGAMLLGAIASPSASASVGTTGFACTEVDAGMTGKFVRAHCRPGLDSEGKGDEGSGSFEEISVVANLKTAMSISNEKTASSTTASTPLLIKGVIAGVAVELKIAGVHGLGSMENSVNAETGEHLNHGEITLEFKEVTATSPSCEVIGLPGGAGKIETKPLKTTTAGQGMGLKFEPKEGTTVAEFELTGGSCPATLKKSYKLVGSLRGTPNGATLNFSHATGTEEKTLRFNAAGGPVAGLEGSWTINGMVFEGAEATSGLTFTTVETK